MTEQLGRSLQIPVRRRRVDMTQPGGQQRKQRLHIAAGGVAVGESTNRETVTQTVDSRPTPLRSRVQTCSLGQPAEGRCDDRIAQPRAPGADEEAVARRSRAQPVRSRPRTARAGGRPVPSCGQARAAGRCNRRRPLTTRSCRTTGPGPSQQAETSVVDLRIDGRRLRPPLAKRLTDLVERGAGPQHLAGGGMP